MREYSTFEDVDFVTRYPWSEDIVSEIVDAIRMEGKPNARIYSFQREDGFWVIEVRKFWGYDIDLKLAVIPFLKYLEDTTLHQVIREEEEGRYLWAINNGKWKMVGGHTHSNLNNHREFHLDKINSNDERLFIDVDMFTIAITRSEQELSVDIYKGDVDGEPIAFAHVLEKVGTQINTSFPWYIVVEGSGLDSNRVGRIVQERFSQAQIKDIDPGRYWLFNPQREAVLVDDEGSYFVMFRDRLKPIKE